MEKEPVFFLISHLSLLFQMMGNAHQHARVYAANMWVYKYMPWICTWEPEEGSERPPSLYLLYCLVSHWTRSLLLQLGWLASECPGSTHLCLPVLEMQVAFYMGTRGLNSGSTPAKKVLVSTEPSPQAPRQNILKIHFLSLTSYILSTNGTYVL